MMTSRLLTILLLACAAFAPAQAQKESSDPLAIDAKHQKDIDADTKKGEEYVKLVEKDLKISKDEEMLKRVQRVGGLMADLANKNRLDTTWGDKRFSKFNYTFKLVEGKDVNAFSLPGGFIYVYEGLVKFVQSDDELAAVLGHEISHAALRHVDTLQREAAKGQLLALPAILATIFAQGQAGYSLPAVQLLNQAQMSGWSVKAEHAADYGGFQLMQKSPYNPTACLTVCERLNQVEKSTPRLDRDWGIFTTHPPSKERVEMILKDMRVAKVPIQRSAVTTAFSIVLKKVDTGYEAWFDNKLIYTFSGDDAQVRAENAQKRLNVFFDGLPALFEVKAQGDRVYGIDQVLISIDPADAVREKITVSQLANKTVSSIQSAIYSLTYRIQQPNIGS